MIFTITERLILRNVQEKDIPVIHDYRNHAICSRYQRGQTKDYSGIEELVKKHTLDILSLEAPSFVAIAEKNTDALIGEISVMPNDETISLGYTVAYNHHRKGIAYEALSALIDHLHERYPDWDFICFTDPENIPSMALLKKLGFQDMGYIPHMDSRVFGKWTSEATETEIAQAIT